MEQTRYDYTGKTVFVGIDVHKKKYILSSRCEGQLIKRWSANASPEQITQQLKNYFRGAKIKTVYEAGFAGFMLHRHLVQNGMDNIVVNPASIEVAAGDKVKTDKRDATKMAVQHEAGRLRGIHIPSETQEMSRLLSRTRASLVKERTRIGQQIKSKLYQFGLIPRDDEHVINRKRVVYWMSQELPMELSVILKSLGRLWLEVREEIKNLEKKLQEQAQQQAPLELIYRSAPGIGAVAARELANELGDMKQFANERALFSFTGLTPCEYSSGDKRRLGHISRCGQSRTRRILIEAAWTAIRKDSVLAEAFSRIAKQAGPKRAIVAIARKLIGKIRSCFRAGVLYKLNHS